MARDLVKEIVAEDSELRGKMKVLLTETANKLMRCDTDKLAERMADALTSSMRRD